MLINSVGGSVNRSFVRRVEVAGQQDVGTGILRELAELARLVGQSLRHFLAAAGHEEDESGKLKKADHYDEKTHSVSFWDGFHRLVDNKMILASARAYSNKVTMFGSVSDRKSA